MEESDNASEEHSQSTPSSTFSTLGQLLQEFRAKKLELAAGNTALWEQMVISALSWEKEKQELLEERDELLSTLFMTQDLFREFDKESDRHSKEIGRKMKEKEMEVCRLQASQIFHLMEAERVRKHLKEERDQAKKMKLSFDKTVTQINAKWKSLWFAREKEVAAELKTLQQDSEKKVSQVIRETAEEITCVRKQVTALVEESQMAFKQMKTEYHAKNTALEDHLRCEQGGKEESLKKIQELQTHSREVEEKWLTKESNMEEQMNLLIRQNELTLKMDKVKSEMREENERAREEAERRLEKQRKEEEERGKREKEEREKMEKERAKREETETERVKRLMKERRDEVERERRERQEREKMETLRREKKENELREEKDRKEKEKKTDQTKTSTLPNIGYLTYI